MSQHMRHGPAAGVGRGRFVRSTHCLPAATTHRPRRRLWRRKIRPRGCVDVSPRPTKYVKRSRRGPQRGIPPEKANSNKAHDFATPRPVLGPATQPVIVAKECFDCYTQCREHTHCNTRSIPKLSDKNSLNKQKSRHRLLPPQLHPTQHRLPPAETLHPAPPPAFSRIYSQQRGRQKRKMIAEAACGLCPSYPSM